MGTRDILERWRPSATPGAPSAAGVPADRVAERSAELEPVFARLATAQAEVDRIRDEAITEAARRRGMAQDQARALISEAQRRCQAERSSAAATAQAAGAESASRILDRAHLTAESIDARARAREPALVARVVALARAELGTAPQGPP